MKTNQLILLFLISFIGCSANYFSQNTTKTVSFYDESNGNRVASVDIAIYENSPYILYNTVQDLTVKCNKRVLNNSNNEEWINFGTLPKVAHIGKVKLAFRNDTAFAIIETENSGVTYIKGKSADTWSYYRKNNFDAKSPAYAVIGVSNDSSFIFSSVNNGKSISEEKLKNTSTLIFYQNSYYLFYKNKKGYLKAGKYTESKWKKVKINKLKFDNYYFAQDLSFITVSESNQILFYVSIGKLWIEMEIENIEADPKSFIKLVQAQPQEYFIIHNDLQGNTIIQRVYKEK